MNKMKQPICAVPGCENKAMIMFSGRLICGECLMKKHYEEQERVWKEFIKDDSN